MRVSVVVCTYALDMYDDFREAVESLLAQTYDDIEVVIVVDGTEAVAERVEDDYGNHDAVSIHVNEENVGLLRSRNRGAEHATGDVVAFIDDDAVADETWVERLVSAYEEEDAIAAGGKMTPIWVAGEPAYLPEEFYWLVGVTHRGFADSPGYVRNTFGSNISFRRDVFLDLGGFDPEIGGRKGDANLQGGETELCTRLATEYGEGVWYESTAKVGHKVFDYRTNPTWLLERAFWQGYSKRAMAVLLPDSGQEETAFLSNLFFKYIPGRTRNVVLKLSATEAMKLLMLFVFTAFVGMGYLYGLLKWR